MKHHFYILLVIAILGFPAVLPAQQGSANRIVVRIENVQTNKGVIRCGLHTRSNWLEAEKAVSWVDATYRPDGSARCVFEGVPKGQYGVGAFHDSDADHDMDTNFLGIPSEGVCASTDPDATMGPPDFSGAKFEHKNATTRVTCTMRY